MIFRALILLVSLSLVGFTSWTATPRTFTSSMFGPVDTIPFRGAANDTLGRLAGLPGFGNVRWLCQDSVQAGTGTAYVWPVTSGASSGVGTLKAAIDSANAHASANNCHDIILIPGGFYSPQGSGARYDNLPNVRISGQTARGEGATFRNFSSVESRGNGADGRILEYFRIRNIGNASGLEGIWKLRSVSNQIIRHISVAWSSAGNNHFIIEGGTNSVPLSGDSSFNHTFHLNLSFEPDSIHPTHFNVESTPDSIVRRLRRLTVRQNLFAGPGRRMPRIGGQVDTVSITHNIAYNWHNWAAQLNAHSDVGPTYRVDFMGFHANRGNRGDDVMPLRIGQNDSTVFRVTVRDIQSDKNSFEVNADPDSLVRGSGRVVGCENVGQETWCNTEDAEVPLNVFSQDTLDTGPSWAEYAITPFDSAARAVVTERAGFSRSLSCGGQWSAWGVARDSIDNRAITEFENNTGVNRLVNTSAERALGEPADGTACVDSDSDGLPNTYETSQCGTTTCIPGWSEWVNGRYAGDWYLQGCNLDGTKVGDRSTACGGEAAAGSSATFGAVDRYVYFVPVITLFGLPFPDITPLTAYRFGARNAAGDTVMVVSCSEQGTPADSATVHARVTAWGLTTFTSAVVVRDHDPFPAMEC